MRKAIVILMVLGIFGLYAGAAFAGLTDTVAVSATVAAGTSSVSITEATITFGTVAPLSTDHRFEAAGPMTVDYFAAGFPWAVRVYTDNVVGGTADNAGLEGADGTSYVPLKVYAANLGPELKPDPEGEYFWAGYDFNGDGDKDDEIIDGSIDETALGFDVNGDGDVLDAGLGTELDPVKEEQRVGWFRIPEDDEHTADKYTWRRLIFHDAERNAAVPPPFTSYLAIDAAGTKAQAYSTTLTVQILNY